MAQSVILNDNGKELFGDYNGAVELTEIVSTFSDTMTMASFRVDGRDVLYGSQMRNVFAPVETTYGEDDEPTYWYLIGATA